MKLDEFLSNKAMPDGDFAMMIGVSRVTVTRWRNGTRFPSRDSLRAIAEATDGAVTADDFVELSATTER